MRITNLCTWAMTGIMSLGMVAIGGGLAMAAEEVAGRPIDKGTGFQRAVTEVARDIQWMDDLLLMVIIPITLFVTLLMLYIVIRFNRKANPKPAAFTHNVVVEVVWTVVPVLILVVIAIPSWRLLFLQLEVPEADLTIKATGSQWYWSYEYLDEGIEFDAIMLQKDELEDNGYTQADWLFATDTRVIVPVDAVVHVLVTGADVIHAWAVPSFGSKIDAVPGRMNETWFRAEETGVFYGQCSELCGKDHTYMPIVVEVVSQDDYNAWVQTQQAMNDTRPTEATTQLAVSE